MHLIASCVAVVLAQAVLAWPFVHGYCGDAQLALSVEWSLDPPSLLIRTYLEGNVRSMKGPPEGLTGRGRPHAAANVWESERYSIRYASKGFQIPLLGPSWDCIGALLGCLGRLLDRFGALSGRPGAVLGAFWAVLGRSWGPLGPSWSVGKPKRRECQKP